MLLNDIVEKNSKWSSSYQLIKKLFNFGNFLETLNIRFIGQAQKGQNYSVLASWHKEVEKVIGASNKNMNIED